MTRLTFISVFNSNPNMEAMIKDGVDVNVQDKNGTTSLISVSSFNQNPALSKKEL